MCKLPGGCNDRRVRIFVVVKIVRYINFVSSKHIFTYTDGGCGVYMIEVSDDRSIINDKFR